MSQKRRAQQRAQRKEKRQIHAQLLSQSRNNKNGTPLSRNINLPNSFSNYAIRETKRDIRENSINDSRIPILERAMQLQKEIETKKMKNTQESGS
jgi:hypothetical protein